MAVILLAAAFTACSRSDTERAHRQAREMELQLQHDSREALHQAGALAHQTNREVTRELDKTRDGARRALDRADQAHPDKSGQNDNPSR